MICNMYEIIPADVVSMTVMCMGFLPVGIVYLIVMCMGTDCNAHGYFTCQDYIFYCNVYAFLPVSVVSIIVTCMGFYL